MKTLLRIFGALLLLLVLAIGALYLLGSSRVNRSYELTMETVPIPGDSASVARGDYLATILGCRDCHGAELAGQLLADVPPFLLAPPNLTPGAGGVGATYTDADWVRSIRHGVLPTGLGAQVMPSYAYYFLSDEELGQVIAYLRTLPPVDSELPATAIKPLGKLLTGLGGAFEPSPEHALSYERLPMPEVGPTAAYGEYRASTLCRACHGEDLLGGQPADPESPLAPSLASVKTVTRERFEAALRRGVAFAGHEMDPAFMPWAAFERMTDDEVEALYLFLQTLPDG